MGRSVNPTGSINLHSQGQHPSQDTVARRGAEGEFGKFAELAGNLIQVPKEELDERRKAES